MIFSGSAVNANGLFWTTNGTGTITSENSNTTVYIVSANDILQPEILMIATSTGNGICLPATETVKLTFAPTAFVDAGPNRIYCDEIPLVDLAGLLTGTTDIEWASNGDGVFVNSVASLSNNYQTTAKDTLGFVVITLSANTGGVGCFNYDQFLLNFEPAPSISLLNTTACEGDTIYLIGQPSNIDNDSTAIYQW